MNEITKVWAAGYWSRGRKWVAWEERSTVANDWAVCYAITTGGPPDARPSFGTLRESGSPTCEFEPRLRMVRESSQLSLCIRFNCPLEMNLLLG